MSFKGRRHPLGVLSLIVGASGAASACGLVIVHAPPPGHEQLASFNCTQSNAGSVFDIVWGGLNVLGALAVSTSDIEVFEHPNRIVGVGLAWGVLSGVSAGVGFDKTRRCREAQSLLLARARATSAPSKAGAGSTAPVAVIITPGVDTIRVGTRVQLHAAAYGSAGSTIPTAAFTWTSSNDAIASVNAAGLVSATAPGTIIVATMFGPAAGTATVVVTAN